MDTAMVRCADLPTAQLSPSPSPMALPMPTLLTHALPPLALTCPARSRWVGSPLPGGASLRSALDGRARTPQTYPLGG
jgi:hypothetical protein